VLRARKVTVSVPARFTTRRRTSNDPLGALVVRLPRAETEPLCTRRQAHDCPLRLLSTSASISMRPSSCPALSFQCVEPVHDLLYALAVGDVAAVRVHLATLVALGHSSGADLAFGLRLGLGLRPRALRVACVSPA